MDSWVLHVDLDQFIAAVEILRRPELRGRAVVVGGDGDPTKRGVVSTASYEARARGVHSGVPLRTAVRRCPDAVFLPVDREAYEAASAVVMATLREGGAPVDVMGWDEAFLGVDSDDPEAVARDIQRRVRAATRLECTVGIGRNKLQAKMATGYGKPAGVYRITDETWFELLGARPPEALWGIGPKTARRLAELGITTVAGLAATDPAYLAERIGPSTGPWLVHIGQGRDDSPVTGEPWVRRSRGRETTFQEDLVDWARVRQEVERMAVAVAREAVAEGRLVAGVVVKVRFVPFTTRTRSRRLGGPTADADTVAQAALVAFDRLTERRAVRLIGVQAMLADVPMSDGSG